MAKRFPAPGWHWPQVFGRFFGLMVECGSDDGQDIVDAVATGAVGHGLYAFLGGQPVVGSVEAHQAVRGHAELAAEPDVAVATAARLADVARRSPAKHALLGLMILCSPWQSVQSGAWVMPLARAWP